MNKPAIEHKDILGNAIREGDIVVYPARNTLRVATVKKINAKMINVVPVGYIWPDRKYPSDLLVVEDPRITLYMLKHNG